MLGSDSVFGPLLAVSSHPGTDRLDGQYLLKPTLSAE